MNAEETKVLRQIIGSIKDYNEGDISQTMLAFDMQEYLPQLMELQNYIVALETDLDEAQQELDEAERAYEDLYHDYDSLSDEISYYEDQEED